MHNQEIEIYYVPKGLISYVGKRLKQIEGIILIEKSWRLLLQRMVKESITERIVGDPDIPKKES